MMLIQLLKVYQDAPDGLYLQYHNSRTQDTSVGPSGVHHLVTPPPHSTGVVQRAIATGLAACTSILVTRTAPVRRLRTVCVPSGV